MDFCFDCVTSESQISSGIVVYTVGYVLVWLLWLYKMESQRRFYAVMLVVFIGLTFDLTLFPINKIADGTSNFSPNFEFFRFITEIHTYQSWQVLKLTVLNVLLFVPLGYFARRAFPRHSVWKAIILVLGLSLFIEGTQAIISWYGFSYRIFDVDDLVVNVFGGILGIIGASVALRSTSRMFWLKQRPLLLFIFGWILMVALCFIGIHIIY